MVLGVNMIKVVFASDENYVPYLLVCLKSLLVNNTSNVIRIFILDNDISLKNKEILMNLVNDTPNFSIEFLAVNNLVNHINISDSQKKGLLSINLTSYSRLFLATLLPHDVDKIIYFDCDALILDSIDELWSINIDEYMCAGVLDTTTTYFKNIVDLDDADTYINAGMLLINLSKWRQEHIEERFLEFLSKKYGENIHHDQGIINGVLRNQILPIHPKFNLLGPFHGKDYNFVKKWFGISYEYYSEELIKEAQENPVFIHFSGGSIERPWVNEKHYYRKLYDSYVELINYDKSMIYRDVGTISEIGKMYVFISENVLGRFIMNLIPNKVALFFKNYVIQRQSSE